MARAIHVFRTPDRFVAGTVGQPGNRTFYLQAVHDKRVISVVLEKQQVAVLAERIAALLLEINRRFGTPIPPETGDIDDLSPLITPVDAEFRVGTMGLGWDSEAQTVVVELLAVSETEFDASVVLDDAEEGPDAVRVFLTPESARQFATRSNRVISAGRPPCPLCDEPLDPEGHICVRTNGYRLAGGGALYVAETGFVTPRGNRMEGAGIQPDSYVPLTLADLRDGVDRDLIVAQEALRSASLRFAEEH